MKAELLDITNIDENIYIVRLKYHGLNSKAGQYIRITLLSGQERYFTILDDKTASAGYFDLMISVNCEDSVSSEIIREIKAESIITISPPLGKAIYQRNNKCFIIVRDAGIAYAIRIINEIIDKNHASQVSLFWKNHRKISCYETNKLKNIMYSLDKFNFSIDNTEKYLITNKEINTLSYDDLKKTTFYLCMKKSEAVFFKNNLMKINACEKDIISDAL